jgi:hypothetical protein
MESAPRQNKKKKDMTFLEEASNATGHFHDDESRLNQALEHPVIGLSRE